MVIELAVIVWPAPPLPFVGADDRRTTNVALELM